RSPAGGRSSPRPAARPGNPYKRTSPNQPTEATMKNKFITLVEASGLKKDVTDFTIGDTVDVHLRILEGEKERVQVFSGVVISRRGEGMRAMFTVRRIVQSEGVERTFPVNSPKIAKIEVKRTGV